MVMMMVKAKKEQMSLDLFESKRANNTIVNRYVVSNVEQVCLTELRVFVDLHVCSDSSAH
jgi:hypothetical protein